MAHALTRPLQYNIRLLGDALEDRAVLVIDPTSPDASNENDLRLGARPHGDKCKTCGQDNFGCPGHLGAYKTIPLPNPITSDSLAQWLNVVCSNCGRIPLSAEEKDLMRKRKGELGYKSLAMAISTKGPEYRCPYCGPTTGLPLTVFRPVPYPVNGATDLPALFYIDSPKKLKPAKVKYLDLPIVSNEKVKEVLKRATYDDCMAMGYNPYYYHPQHFITTFIPITPPAARPRSLDQSKNIGAKTRKVYERIEVFQRKVSTVLRETPLEAIQKTMTEEDFKELISTIYHLYFISCVLQTSIPDGLYTASRLALDLPVKQPPSILSSLKGKKGYMRDKLGSTRHDVNIRTPLAGNILGALGTVTFPRRAAMKITRPMIVTPGNLEICRLLAANGPTIYPGANSYIRGKDTFTIREDNATLIASSLIPGDILMRHTLTGDIGLNQRYPSVREESIWAVLLQVIPGNLVRVSPQACLKLMADFDGDDVQVFIDSCLGVDAEALLLQSILRQWIAPMNGSVLFGMDSDLNMDATSGVNLIIRRGTFTREEISALFDAAYSSLRMKCAEKEKYTSIDIFDAILPAGLYYDAKAHGDTSAMKEVKKTVDGKEVKEQIWLKIEDGRIVTGMPNAKGFAIGDGYILKAIYGTLGPLTAVITLENMTKIAYRANSLFGISIRDDVRPIPQFEAKMKAIVDIRLKRMQDLSMQYHTGRFAIPVGQNPHSYYELVQSTILANLGAGDLYTAIREMFKGSSIEEVGYLNEWDKKLILGLGSRGQIMLTDGYQEPGRPWQRLARGTRHLYFFPKGDDGPSASGYITHGYVQGLTPAEHFYDSAMDRWAVYQKGSGVREQGYFNRKLGTSLDPYHVDHLGFIRGHSDAIVAPSYGLLGTDPRAVYSISIDAHLLPLKDFQARYAGAPAEEMKILTSIRDQWRSDISDYGRVTSNEGFNPLNTTFTCPIDLSAILASEKGRDGRDGGKGEKGRPASREEVWNELKRMDALCELCHIGERAGPYTKTIVRDRVRAFMRLFRFSVHSGSFEGWTLSRVQKCLGRILYLYGLSLAAPGDPVGKKAVLNVVSPQSQAVLHSTRSKGAIVGGSTDNVLRTKGTKLFREHTEGTKPKHPIISFMLKGSKATNFSACFEFMKRHSGVMLKHVLSEAHLVSVDPKNLPTSAEGSVGLQFLTSWLASLPPTAKKVYERLPTSSFFIVLRIDVRSLHINRIDPFLIGHRLAAQYPEEINYAAPIYDNANGMYIMINLSPDLSIERITRTFDQVVERSYIHGHSDFTNGSVIKFNGVTSVNPKTGKLEVKPTWRIMFNGSDVDYLYSLGKEIDRSTIILSGMKQSAETYGIEECRFRVFDTMNFECEGWDVMKGTQTTHLQMISGFATHRGTPTFITRTGVGKRADMDPLEKIAFETANVFLRQTIKKPDFREIRTGMASRLYGTVPPIGSGISPIVMSRESVFPSTTADEVMDRLSKSSPPSGSTAPGSETEPSVSEPVEGPEAEKRPIPINLVEVMV